MSAAGRISVFKGEYETGMEGVTGRCPADGWRWQRNACMDEVAVMRCDRIARTVITGKASASVTQCGP